MTCTSSSSAWERRTWRSAECSPRHLTVRISRLRRRASEQHLNNLASTSNIAQTRRAATIPLAIAFFGPPVERWRLALRAALAHPVGIVLLLASMGLAVAASVLPVLRPLANGAVWIVALGLAA